MRNFTESTILEGVRKMFEITNCSYERMKAALKLLELKANRLKAANDGIHCFIDWEDVEEVLCVAGFFDEGEPSEKEAPFA